MEYTKGEWKIYNVPYTVVAVDKGRETMIAGIHKQPNEEHEANANLIASAPDNYKANKGYDFAIGTAITALARQEQSLADVVQNILLPAQEEGRKAIAKAEGRL